MPTAHITGIAHAMNKFNPIARALRSDERGNVMMIFGFAVLPLVFAAGMGIDYASAMKAQSKLNAAADAAALAAVTQPMMTQPNSKACETARKMFAAQASDVSTVQLDMDDPEQFWITLEDNDGEVVDCASSDSSLASSAAFGRTITVSYRGESANFFGGILGRDTLVVSGSSQSFAAVAPNIDFYVMVDTSQSMLLPATTADLTKMINNTKSQGGGLGCAFACHQTETRPAERTGTDKYGNATYTRRDNEITGNPIDPRDAAMPNPNDLNKDTRRRIDNLQLARNLGLVLRSDLVKEAVADLTTVAANSAATNGAAYRMGLSTFDRQFRRIFPTTGNTGDQSTYFVSTALSTIRTNANALAVEGYYLNNRQSSTNSDNDTHTRFHDAFAGILNTMPLNAGNGEDTGTPQAILFLITDGMWDRRLPASGSGVNGEPEGPIWNVKNGSGIYVKDAAQNQVKFCDDVKARNIRIAVLYTEYLPSSASDAWSVTHVKNPYLVTDKISPALQACASTGLYYKVTTDDDISAALTTLFQKAVATARLTR